MTNDINYIQYLTKNQKVKVKEVIRTVQGSNVLYTLENVPEEFFILALFDNNKKVSGITFDNVQNLDMLAFLNSDFVTLDVVPDIGFFPAYQEVVMNVSNFLAPTQLEKKYNYPPQLHKFFLDDDNNIEGINFSYTDVNNTAFVKSISLLNGVKQYNLIDTFIPLISTYDYGMYNYKGFHIQTSGMNIDFDLVLNTAKNQFYIQKPQVSDPALKVHYFGYANGLHKFIFSNEGDPFDAVMVYNFAVYVGFNPSSQNSINW